MIILEEAAYCDPQFFFETVSPLLIVGRSCLLAISTLTSEINFYTRLMRIKDPATGERVFKTFQIELACAKCKEMGRAGDCQHMLHLVPRWQSSQKHERMKLVMQVPSTDKRISCSCFSMLVRMLTQPFSKSETFACLLQKHQKYQEYPTNSMQTICPLHALPPLAHQIPLHHPPPLAHQIPLHALPPLAHQIPTNPKIQNRPDLIQSELSGLAFDSLQQAFRAADIDRMMIADGMLPLQGEPIFIFIDPAAGGPQSDYCVLSLTRQRGIITVPLSPFYELRYRALTLLTRSEFVRNSFCIHRGMVIFDRSVKNRFAFSLSIIFMFDKCAHWVASLMPNDFRLASSSGLTISCFICMSTFIINIHAVSSMSNPAPLAG